MDEEWGCSKVCACDTGWCGAEGWKAWAGCCCCRPWLSMGSSYCVSSCWYPGDSAEPVISKSCRVSSVSGGISRAWWPCWKDIGGCPQAVRVVNRCRGCPTSDKHALANKVSLSALTVVLFRGGAGCRMLDAGCCSWGFARLGSRVYRLFPLGSRMPVQMRAGWQWTCN